LRLSPRWFCRTWNGGRIGSSCGNRSRFLQLSSICIIIRQNRSHNHLRRFARRIGESDVLKSACCSLLLAAVIPQAVLAADFTCRNESAQTSCTADKCETTTDGFTPMALSRTGNRLEICAYSDCFGGRILLSRTRGSVTLLSADVRGRSGAPGQLAVVYDRRTRSAAMHWSGFVNALSCAPAR
jgi:hypothetical protein